MSATIAAEIIRWPTKDRMVMILRDAGLRVRVGLFSIRVEDCSHFVFQEYGGDLGDPRVEADADTVDDMIRDGRLVSEALARAGIRHCFEVYNDRNELAGYLHYELPLEGTPD